MAVPPSPDDATMMHTAEALRAEIHSFRITRQLLITAMSVLTAAAIALGVIFGVYLHNTRVQANQNHDILVQIRLSQLTACRDGNDRNTRQVQLWKHLVAVTGNGKPETPLAKAFIRYVEATFPQRNCAKLYPVPPPRH